MYVHLKGIALNMPHVLVKLVYQHFRLVVLGDKEQVLDIVPIYPIIEQSGAFVNVLIDKPSEVKHILLGTVIHMNDLKSPFFKLSDIVMIVIVDRHEILQVIVHSLIGLFEVAEQACPQLAEVADNGSLLVGIQSVQRVLALVLY